MVSLGLKTTGTKKLCAYGDEFITRHTRKTALLALEKFTVRVVNAEVVAQEMAVK